MNSRTNPAIEARARELLKQVGCGQVPIPIERIALEVGLSLEPMDISDDISGVLVIGQGQSAIGYNASHAVVRQRFTIAHEIGHFLLHGSKRDLFIDKGYTAIFRRDQAVATGDYLLERQANQFAAALLMPEDLVRNEVRNIEFDLADETALRELAKKFEVSTQAMSLRLAHLGIFGTMQLRQG